MLHIIINHYNTRQLQANQLNLRCIYTSKGTNYKSSQNKATNKDTCIAWPSTITVKENKEKRKADQETHYQKFKMHTGVFREHSEPSNGISVTLVKFILFVSTKNLFICSLINFGCIQLCEKQNTIYISAMSSSLVFRWIKQTPVMNSKFDL